MVNCCFWSDSLLFPGGSPARLWSVTVSPVPLVLLAENRARLPHHLPVRSIIKKNQSKNRTNQRAPNQSRSFRRLPLLGNCGNLTLPDILVLQAAFDKDFACESEMFIYASSFLNYFILQKIVHKIEFLDWHFVLPVSDPVGDMKPDSVSEVVKESSPDKTSKSEDRPNPRDGDREKDGHRDRPRHRSRSPRSRRRPRSRSR